MVREHIREEYEGEEEGGKDTSLEEIIPNEMARFLHESESEDGDTEEEKSFDADEGEEECREEHAEIGHGSRVSEECYELCSEEEEEKEREVLGQREMKEEKRDEASGKKDESVPHYFRSECSEERVEREE